MSLYKYYRIENDNKITRSKKFCPKCNDLRFMGDHNNRYSCGYCGYIEYKN